MIEKLGASPGLKAGRGLKHACDQPGQKQSPASPGLTAGRGLKPLPLDAVRIRLPHRPASRPGTD